MIIERSIHDTRDTDTSRLRVECAEAYARMAANVLDTFERLAGAGDPPRPGMQIRFGWSLLRLGEDGDALRVTEPDFAAWPRERWAPTIDVTLDVLAAQTALLHQLDVAGEDAFFDQAVIAAPGALAQPEIFLRRTDRISAEDSGWLLGTLDDPEALTRGHSLESVLIASLVERRRALLQALTLPTGFLVIFSGDSVQILDAAGRLALQKVAHLSL